MKILAINNYSCEVKNDAPHNHCWSVDFFREQGNTVETMTYNGYSNNRILSLLNRVIFNIKILIISRKYDVVISYFSPILDFLGLFKSLGLVNCRLYTFVHHYGRLWQVSNAFDRVFFISEPIMELYKKSKPTLTMTSFIWGPDLDFYDKLRKFIPPTDNRLRLISTGKTNRDIQIAIDACHKTNTSLTVIDSNRVMVDDTIVKTNDHHYGNIISYPEMVGYMNCSDITLITVNKDFSKTDLCGLTSFIDALALGQPIIMADNTNIGIDIEKLQIGLIYKAGDLDDLSTKISLFQQNPNMVFEYGNNARKFAEEHSYKHFCEELYKEIFICNG